ncbi:UNKNOWN [Stylonychia lemnae]|uniref:Uncharacterized protein n=1 Tax=Stylonychia lemnae TaxID=5949 RepID=A0A077ZZR9_STYLE|nr:UNKNOWN [Stylonychia lemnae]|eukprot:CDW75117.1 UNKNOWN [Stylonychia lemnae]
MERVKKVHISHPNIQLAISSKTIVQIFGHFPSISTQTQAILDRQLLKERQKQTLEMYQLFYGFNPDQDIWGYQDEKLNQHQSEMIYMNLPKLINIELVRILNNKGYKMKLDYSLYELNFMDRYSKIKSLTRKSYVINRRKYRMERKIQNGIKCDQKRYNLMRISGGPLIFPKIFETQQYQGDLIVKLLKGLYRDYNLIDQMDVKLNQKTFGSQECLERLLDLAIGDYDIQGHELIDYKIDDQGNQFQMGNLGDGLQEVLHKSIDSNIDSVQWVFDGDY